MPQHAHPAEEMHHLLSREINELYWSLALSNFSVGLVGLFVPIYMFQYFGGSFVAVFTFYIVQSIAQTILIPFSARLLHVWGLKKLIAIGRVFLAVYLMSLMLLGSFPGITFIVIATVAKIIFLITTPLALHTDFAKFTSGKKRGRQVSGAHIVTVLSRAAAPLIGGYIIVSLGYAPVYIVATMLLIISTAPLFFSEETYEHFSLNWGQSFARVFAKKNLRTSFAFFCEGAENVAGIFLFPIFLFLVIGKIDTLGWVTSLSLSLTFFISYFVGWITDKKGGRSVMSFTSVAHAFSWVVNAFIVTPFQFIVFSSFYRLAATGNRLPMTTLFYENAQKRGHGVDEYVVFHEIAHNLGRIFIFSVFIIGFAMGYTSFMFYFVLVGLAALLYRLMR